MERKEFLQKVGMGTLLLPVLQACSKASDPSPSTSSTTTTSTSINTGTGTCTTSPTETDGPYPLYASRGSSINRLDITDGKTGIPLNVTITVVNTNNNCAVIQNARVDIWHCDKDGYYSGYSNTGYLGTQDNTSKVFCRGLQYTDSNGIARFTTIYPGWYTGRITHIHAQVYVNSVLKLTTQIAFPDDINKAVYQTSLYSAHGLNTSVTSNATDSVFSDSYANELATVTANSSGGYDLSITIKVAA